MTGPMSERDEQDQSEVFDETHIDDEGEGDLLLDEAGPVLDVTRAKGDGADYERPRGVDAEASEYRHASQAIEAEADALLGRPARAAEDDDEDPSGPAEIELVYTGLMREVRGAQASAAHWEARRLSDDDIADLGYGPDAEAASPPPSRSPAMTSPRDRSDTDVDAPAARPAPREHGKPDQLRESERHAENRQEALIDEAVEETFPASDPPTPKHIT
jgi:hypothetical protein